MVKDVMLARRSIRRYQARPVEEDKVAAVLAAACLAPSGSNTQPWRFIVVRDDAKRAALAEVSHRQAWMKTAPVHIVCVADSTVRTQGEAILTVDEDSPAEEVKQIIRDTAIAVDHLTLAAAAEGLGTCWVAWFRQAEIRPLLGVPPECYVVAVITLGYADEQPGPRPRQAVAEMVRYEHW